MDVIVDICSSDFKKKHGFRRKFEAMFPISVPQNIAYEVFPLAIVKVSIYVAFFAYLVILLRSPIVLLPATQFFFDVNSGLSNGAAQIPLNDLVGNGTLYPLDQLVLQEGPNNVLVTTYFYDQMEAWDEVNKEWVVLNETTVFVPIKTLLQLNINVNSRISCTDFFKRKNTIFSNYNKAVPSEQINYALTLESILGATVDIKTDLPISTCLNANPKDPSFHYVYHDGTANGGVGHVSNCCEDRCPYGALAYGNGADISVEYNWSCSLDRYRNASTDRYLCASNGGLAFSAELLSNTAILTRTHVVESPSISSHSKSS